MMKNEKEPVIDFIIIFMIFFLILGSIIILLLFFSYSNLISYLSGGLIAILNFLWLKRLIKKLADEKKFTKKAGIEWGLKIIIIFGLITFFILKTKINILIFLSGLSILPIAVTAQSIAGYFKFSGGR